MAQASIITHENFTSRPCQQRGGWTLDQLKEFARSQGLKVSGTKAILCERIRDALGLPAEAEAAPPSPPRSPPRPPSPPGPPRPYGPSPRPPPKPPAQAQLTVWQVPPRRSRRPSTKPTPESTPPPTPPAMAPPQRPVETVARPSIQPQARPQIQPITPVRIKPSPMTREAAALPSIPLARQPPARGPSPPRVRPQPPKPPQPELLPTGPLSQLNPCDEFSQNAVPEATINGRREYIFDTIRQLYGGNPNRIAEMTNADLQAMLGMYDDLFLQGRLRNYLQRHPDEDFKIEFGRTTGVAGYCRTRRRPRCSRTLSMSRPVHSRIFTGSEAHATETNAGLQCTTQLGCLQLTLEHELIHLLIDIWCAERIRREGTTRGGRRAPREVHGDLFKAMARNLFGHRDFRHSLGRGLTEDPAVHIARAKELLQPGMMVPVYERRSRAVINYEVLEINRRGNVKRFLGRSPDGKRYRIPLVNVILPGETAEDIEAEGEESGVEGEEISEE